MEEKKQIKISLKTAIIIVCIFLVIFIIVGYFIFNKITSSQRLIPDTVSVKTYKNTDYYIIEKDYAGDYDIQYLSLADYDYLKIDTFEVKEVMSYSNYKSYCDKWGINAKYSDSTKEYIVFSYQASRFITLKARLAGIEYQNSNVDIYMWDSSHGLSGNSAYVLVIPTEESINNINIIPVYTDDEFKNIQTYGASYWLSADKPIIYLYPEEEQEISVKLKYNDAITVSYPKYTNGWKVLAKENGTLTDIATNRKLYSLYYECQNTYNFQIEKDGFIVKGEEVAEFLEEKLAILGLTEREAEEFIIYWLPKLEANSYNYIRFATIDEIDANMPLEINPNPDTVIRVLMTFKGLDKPIEIQEQHLETPNRAGSIAVEWGGTEIK